MGHVKTPTFQFCAQLCGLLLLAGQAGADTAPTITKQPVDASVSLGAKVVFTATTTGSPAPTFQWQFRAMDLPAATNRTLTLTNIQLTQAGEYQLVAANTAGAITSRVTRLDVDPMFTQIAAPLFNIAGGSSGASWTDVNNDGWLDLFIVGKFSGGTVLCTNRGDGTFGKATGTGIAASGIGGASWGDYDNDGWPDLFVAGDNALYHNQHNGTFKKSVLNVGSTYCLGWADVDGDGFLDLFAGNYYTGGTGVFVRNNGAGALTKVTTNALVRGAGNLQGISWADYDNDGRPDLFIAVTSGEKCQLYHNDGGGNFTRVMEQPPVLTAGNFACGAWGDYDNDGRPDLFVCGYNQKHLLFHNEGNGVFTTVTNAGPIITDAGDDQSAGWADYDNDGWLDLFVCSGGPTHGLKDFLYHNNGDGTFTKITTGSLANDTGEGAAAAWGDYDRDGFPDLFVTNFQNLADGDKSNYLYHNSGNTNSWLTVRCLGRVSNTSGIGAKVRVRARIGGREVWQLREISGGGAYLSQHSPEAMFGLGDATQIETIRIEWPSGTVQELTGIAPRQFLTVREPARLRARSFSGDDFQVELVGGPAAYFLETSGDLQTWDRPSPTPVVSGVLHFAAPANPANSAHWLRVVEADAGTP